jgi:hypothetical protein
LVNYQQLLFTSTEWHPNFGKVYAKTVEKKTIGPL